MAINSSGEYTSGVACGAVPASCASEIRAESSHHADRQ